MRIEVSGTIKMEDLFIGARSLFRRSPMISFRDETGKLRSSNPVSLFVHAGSEQPLNLHQDRPGKRVTLLVLIVLLLLGTSIPFLSVLLSIKVWVLVGIYIAWSPVALYALLLAGRGLQRWYCLHVLLPAHYRNNIPKLQQSLVLNDTSFVWNNGGKEIVYSWADIADWEETEHGVLLFENEQQPLATIRTEAAISRGLIGHVFPRHLFTDAQYQELRAFLAERLSVASPHSAAEKQCAVIN